MKSQFTRRAAFQVGVVGACSAAIAACTSSKTTTSTFPELYQTGDESELRAAARAIADLDFHCTMITVDDTGMPRARTMSVNMPEGESSFWMSTRPGSRKLDQLSGNPKTCLHFADTEQWGYATFMGTTKFHADEATVLERSFFPDDLRDQLFPEFPQDMVMVEFKLEWLEVAGRGVRVHPKTWQPQGIRVL
ncbi:MAG: pyridoxamine 5'-phosphate oxidase family protein [Pseudomonadota bacterium]